MGSEKTDEKNDTPGATSDPAPEAVLSEDARNELKNELRTEFEEAQANLSEENKTLRNKVHAMSVEARITELEDSGFKDAPGLLAEIRTQMLADDGQPALVLSEQSDGETKEVSLSVSESIERIIQALPKSDDGRVNFADQALSVEDHSAPPAKPNNGGDNAELSEDERIDALAEGLGKTELVTKESSKDGDN